MNTTELDTFVHRAVKDDSFTEAEILALLNEALLAVAVLALTDNTLRSRLVEYRKNMADEVDQADQALQAARRTHGTS